MKVYGALEAAQIEWFTNAGKPAASSYPFRVIYVTDLKQIQVSDGTNWNPSALYTYTAGTLPAAGASNQYQVAFITDTLQVKVSNGTEWKTIGARLDTYTSGTIPAAASNSNSIIWVSDLQQVQVSNGTSWVQVGSKAGTKNYFSQNNANSDFETNSVSPWSACTLTFSSGVPSGAPTLTATQMAISTTSTTPLSGTYSMLLTKSAANAQYQGFISGALTIDREDTAKVLYGSFYYEVVSGTIDLSGSSTQSLEIWIYNTVSGQWTQPAGYRGMNQSSGVGRVVFSFQTDGTYANNAYKIAVITQQTITSAFVVEFDDFVVGPQAIVLGSAMTDWQSYTPTFTGFGTATNIEFQWRRIGDSVQVKGKFTAGTPTATEARISLPSGMTSADTSKIPTLQQAGTVAISTNSATSYYSLIEPSVTYLTFGFQNSTSNALTKANGSTFTTASTVNSVLAQVPIQGWGSFSQMSSDTDTKVVAAQYKGNTGAAVTANVTNIPFSTVNYDTSGSWNGTVWTAPVTGFYQFQGGVTATASVNIDLWLYKNGSAVFLCTQNRGVTTAVHGFNGYVQLNAGETVSIRSDTGFTLNNDLASHFININRLSGPSVITATETVAARYTNTSAQSIPNNSATNLTNWTKDFDTHNFIVSSTGVATINVSGKYTISASLLFAAGAFGAASQYSLIINQTGSATREVVLGSLFTWSAGNNYVQINGSTTLNLLAGDTIRPSAFQFTGSAKTLDPSGNYNYFTITRVGN